jgi:hypothetical protein
MWPATIVSFMINFFLIYKMEIMPIPTSWGCCRDSLNCDMYSTLNQVRYVINIPSGGIVGINISISVSDIIDFSEKISPPSRTSSAEKV